MRSISAPVTQDGSVLRSTVEGADTRIADQDRFKNRSQPNVLQASERPVDGQVSLGNLS